MSAAVLSAVAAIAAALIAASVTYLALRFEKSGRIEHSAAAELWAAVDAHAGRLEREIIRLNVRIEADSKACSDRINVLQSEINTLRGVS